MLEDNCIVPEQSVLDVFVVTEDVSIDSEKVMEIDVPTETPVWLSVGEVDETVGAVESITNDVIVIELLDLPAESVTVIVQSEYVPSLKELRVIILFPITTDVVLEEQDPPYVIVPDSLEENV